MNTTGWECPKCGRCYAPHVSQCMECGPAKQAVNVPTVHTSGGFCTCGTSSPLTSDDLCSVCGKLRITFHCQEFRGNLGFGSLSIS